MIVITIDSPPVKIRYFVILLMGNGLSNTIGKKKISMK